MKDVRNMMKVPPLIVFPKSGGVAYNIYRNQLGQIMLDPVKAGPVDETWLYENKPALASVKRGLAQSAAGRTKKRGSFAIYASED